MKYKGLIAGLFLLIPGILGAHPLHLTVTNLEYKAGASKWEMTVKIFSDDFSAVLALNQMPGLDLRKLPGQTQLEPLLGWLSENLVITFDHNRIPGSSMELKSWKTREDATWMTFEFSAPMPVDRISVRNTLLFDLYPDQKNLFIFTMGQIQLANEFKHRKPDWEVSLKGEV